MKIIISRNTLFIRLFSFIAKLFQVKSVFEYFPMLDEEDVSLRKIILHTAPYSRMRFIKKWAEEGEVNFADCDYDWATYTRTIHDLHLIDLALTRGRLVMLVEDGVKMASRRVEVDKYMIALYNYAFEE